MTNPKHPTPTIPSPAVPTKGDAATLAQVDDQNDSHAAAQDQADKDAARRTRSERLHGVSVP